MGKFIQSASNALSITYIDSWTTADEHRNFHHYNMLLCLLSNGCLHFWGKPHYKGNVQFVGNKASVGQALRGNTPR